MATGSTQEDNISLSGEEIDAEISFSALDAASKLPKSHGSWLLDSCCSRHMSGDLELFYSIQDISTPTFVNFGDGKRLMAQGSGQVITPIGPVEAIYVPHLCANLLSVSQLNKIGATVRFLPEKSEILLDGRRFPVSLVNNIFQVDDLVFCHSSMVTDHKEDLGLWHQKLGHINIPTTISYLKRFGIHPQKSGNMFCRTCALAKLPERRFISRSDVSNKVLGRVHSDIGGPIDRSHQGFAYWITFLDEKSRFAEVRYLKKKSEAAICARDTLKLLSARRSCGVSVFRTDGGGEYRSVGFQDFLRENGIEHEVTPPYTPQMNGMAERLNRTLIERVRCLLVSSGLNNSFWKEAMDYSVYVYNRTPHSGLAFKTPFEVFHDLSLKKLPRFHVFGSVCYFHVAKELRSKLDMTGKKGIFLGFSNTATLVLSLPELSIEEVRTVQVNEGKFLLESELKELGIHRSLSSADIIPLSVESSDSASISHGNSDATDVVMNIPETEGDHEVTIEDVTEEELNQPYEGELLAQDAEPYEGEFVPDVLSSEIEGDEEVADQVEEHLGRQRVRRNNRHSYVEDDVEWHPSFGRRRISDDDDEMWQEESSSEEESYFVELMEMFLTCKMASHEDVAASAREATIVQALVSEVTNGGGSSSSSRSEPRSFKEAVKDPEWRTSMKEEYDSLMNNKTWKLVELPRGRKIVKNKWVYKVKSDGRLKSRLVAKGFTQVAGVDFDETWSPVGRKASLKMLISFVLRNGWSWKQMDVDTAFLNSHLDEEIYMAQPEGYDDGSGRVCQLLKSIYGLKQASRAWYDTLRQFLESEDLQRSRVDPCIYFGKELVIFVYVDDLIIAGSNHSVVEDMSNKFKNRFRMKDLGKPQRILGLDLVEVDDGIMLSGVSTIEELLERCQMSQSRPVSTPMDPNQMFRPNTESKSSEDHRLNFASVMGSLLYIANTFRPDISYAVSVLSQFTGNPSDDHWRGVKRVLRYLSGTRTFGLLIKKDEVDTCGLRGFTDADFAGCFSRKSRTGYAFFVGASMVSWCSRKQSVIALSTCEAEYYALTEGGKEAMHLKKLFWEINNQQPLPDYQTLDTVILYCDNQSTIFVSKNPAEHKMMKHVDLRYKWIQEKVDAKEFQVDYVSTKSQIADIFTKALTKEVFERLRILCGVVDQTMRLAREC